MKKQDVTIKLPDGEMGAYVTIPDGPPTGAVIAIQEIWGLNDTMRHHAEEYANAGYICLVPDLFWRQEPGVELSDRNAADAEKAFDLYFEFDYDLAVRDMWDTRNFLAGLPQCNGKIGAVGFCLGGKLCYLMCCRTDIDCAVAYYGSYIDHSIREAKILHRPLLFHMALKDRWVQPEIIAFLQRRLGPSPFVEIHEYSDADHAFARKGGLPYREDDARLAHARSTEFFDRYLK